MVFKVIGVIVAAAGAALAVRTLVQRMQAVKEEVDQPDAAGS